MTPAERELWGALRSGQLQGIKFRRQAAIGPFIVDFVAFESRVIVEVDGGQHNTPTHRERDDRRTDWLESQGFRVMRFWNFEVLEDLDAVVEAIWRALQEPDDCSTVTPSPGSPPSPALPTRGRGTR